MPICFILVADVAPSGVAVDADDARLALQARYWRVDLASYARY